MTRTLALLLLALASAASAADPASGPFIRYKLAGKAAWEGEIVGRRGITLNDTLPSRYELCMVPPGGDWALESKDPKIEEQYLQLLWRVVTSDGLLASDNDGTWSGTCGDVKRYGQIGDYKRMDDLWWRLCKSEMRVPEPHKYACIDKKVVPTGFVLVTSLKELLQSDHPETVAKALSVAREVKNAGALFGPIIAQRVIDQKLPEPVRAKAAEALATLAPTALSGKTITSLWMDESLKPETRVAAMNAFAFVLRYGDAHGQNTSVALKSYLSHLKGLNQEHLNDATGKADAIGEAAYCAGVSYLKSVQDDVKAGR